MGVVRKQEPCQACPGGGVHGDRVVTHLAALVALATDKVATHAGVHDGLGACGRNSGGLLLLAHLAAADGQHPRRRAGNQVRVVRLSQQNKTHGMSRAGHNGK